MCKVTWIFTVSSYHIPVHILYNTYTVFTAGSRSWRTAKIREGKTPSFRSTQTGKKSTSPDIIAVLLNLQCLIKAVLVYFSLNVTLKLLWVQTLPSTQVRKPCVFGRSDGLPGSFFFFYLFCLMIGVIYIKLSLKCCKTSLEKKKKQKEKKSRYSKV